MLYNFLLVWNFAAIFSDQKKKCILPTKKKLRTCIELVWRSKFITRPIIYCSLSVPVYPVYTWSASILILLTRALSSCDGNPYSFGNLRKTSTESTKRYEIITVIVSERFFEFFDFERLTELRRSTVNVSGAGIKISVTYWTKASLWYSIKNGK